MSRFNRIFCSPNENLKVITLLLQGFEFLSIAGR